MSVLLTGLSFPESPRWHDGRLYVCDWAAQELVAVDLHGHRDLIANVPSFPFCIAFTPDDRLLINSAAHKAVLTLTPGGQLAHVRRPQRPRQDPAEQRDRRRRPRQRLRQRRRLRSQQGRATYARADRACDPRRPGDPGRRRNRVRERDGDHAGQPDAIVSESYATRLTAFDINEDGTLDNRRVRADLGEDPPDGICLTDRGSSVRGCPPTTTAFASARRRGAGPHRVDRGRFSCALGGPDGKTLFVAAREWAGLAAKSRNDQDRA